MSLPRTRNRQRGLSLIEILLAAAMVALASLTAVTYVTRGAQHTQWTRDKVFARQKAMAMLAELRAHVDGGAGGVAADLDGYDDGAGYEPSLTIAADPATPGAYLPPAAPASANVLDGGRWRWHRQVSIRPFPGVPTRDLRICTVRVYRTRANDKMPGERMAELSSVVRSVGDAFPSSQVYDVYLIACENVPGWWVFMDSIQPFVEAALSDLEGRNPGLKFRTHWITKLGYGRDEEYAPYTNRDRDSRATTPWTHVYPGAMPAGEAAHAYYVPERFQARMNLDGAGAKPAPNFVNGASPTNPEPYALADMHNHCMRYPDAVEKFRTRVAAGTEDAASPSWRLLLDTMLLEPQRFHNAIFINLHGELLPMPPARNYSDAAADPETRAGWRAVTHPERLVSTRVPGDDAASKAPVFRVHAFKTDFLGTAGQEVLMSQEEPFEDANRNGTWDAAESFEDWNGDGTWTAALPITVVIGTGDFTSAPNGAVDPSLVIECLPGGIDADSDGKNDPYVPLHRARSYPEAFADGNGNGVREKTEVFFDIDGDGVYGAQDPHQELDGNGTLSTVTETLTDVDGDGEFDADRPAESFTDANGNGRWDAAEPYWDYNGNGRWDKPTADKKDLPGGWRPWDPKDYGKKGAEKRYLTNYGEPFKDLDGDQTFDEAEAFQDNDGNGVRDAGYERGEMWYRVRYDAARGTVLELHSTPLETPHVGSQGLPARCRLYDLEYVPCPTPAAVDALNRFGRDLATNGDVPKNTARWRITVPTASLRRAFASAPGMNDGDREDLLLSVDTRLGTDVDTGSMWPVRRAPQNRSRTYTYLFADIHDVPFSERYQFRGDPRHCPYEDTDRRGTTAPNGYNWFWDNFTNGGEDERGSWLAFDTARLRDGWMGASDHDTPRLMQWLRTGLVETEALWTTLTGFSYYYLSCGGDVGYDAANGFPNSIPMNGLPFGRKGDVFENTITRGTGTKAIRGSRKFVMYAQGKNEGIRKGGAWWSKPWLGENSDDLAYAAQWRASGNHLAGIKAKSRKGMAKGGKAAQAALYRLARKDEIPTKQQPRGTVMHNAVARTGAEGSTTLFNTGTAGSTFHHQFAGTHGRLVGEGVQLGSNYNYPVPASTPISRPFHPATGGSGGVGPAFSYTDSYPRFLAEVVHRYYDHDKAGVHGSGLMKLTSPGADQRSAWFAINGIDRTASAGSAFIARYSVISLLHSYVSAGIAAGGRRVSQLPHVTLRSPTLISDLNDPEEIQVVWSAVWRRWDGRKYTEAYPDDWAGDEADLVYVPLYSNDGGTTWLSMLDDQPLQAGSPGWVSGVGPDPAHSVPDQKPGADEVFTWITPAAKVPKGTYVVRIEAYRKSEGQHYATHQETIHVRR